MADASEECFPDRRDIFHFQIALAGWGYYDLDGVELETATPGKALLTLQPLQHRLRIPEESPGFVSAWITAVHPYLAFRLAKQVAATGSIVDVSPNDPLVAAVLRLIRGAFQSDFRDKLEAEIALVKLVLAFERLAQDREPSERQRLINQARAVILARLPKAVGVPELAAEFGMARSNFSNFFRSQTGMTPADFATNVRLQKAESMLIETRARLKTIADACGFGTANHLCKVFRRLRYTSPSAFRQGRR